MNIFKPRWEEGTVHAKSDQLMLRGQLHDLQVSAITTISAQSTTSTDNAMLETLIEMFDSQVRALESRLLGDFGKYRVK